MTLTPLNCDRRPPGELKAGEWLSLHIFYAADRGPLLTRCVGPLIEKLNSGKLISGHFFVRHWLEGPQLRVRIRPRIERLSEVCGIIENDVSAFLEYEPSVYDPERDFEDEFYKQRFLVEFSQQQWTQRYGADGRMPRNENDTFGYFEYVPEVDRYGGHRGVEIAEWHAEKSSDLVIRLLASNNVHVRTVLLGLGTQLMLAMARAFMEDAQRLAWLFGSNLASWEWMFSSEYERYEQAYQQMSNGLAARVQQICTTGTDGRAPGLPGFVPEWIEHCSLLRDRLVEAADAGMLFDPNTGHSVSSLPDTDREKALACLVLSYMHLTNNRLGITVSSENYLSYALQRAITDRLLT